MPHTRPEDPSSLPYYDRDDNANAECKKEERRGYYRRHWTYVFIGTLVMATVAVITTYVLYHQQVYNESEEILQQLNQTESINVEVSPTVNNNNNRVTISLQKRPSTNDDELLQFDAQVSYIDGPNLINATVVSNRGMYTIQDLESRKILSRECLSPEQVPPLSSLSQQIQNAAVVAVNTSDCSGKWIELTFAGEPYIFCHDNNLTAAAFGNDFKVSLSYNNSQGRTTTSSFVSDEEFLQKCAELRQDAPLTSWWTSATNWWSSTMRTISSYYNAITGNQQESSVAIHNTTPTTNDETQCKCKGEKKPCLFVHGVGMPEEGNVTSTYKYFGGIEDRSPCCSSTSFMHMNTVDYTWFDLRNQLRVCDAAMELSSEKNRNISDVIIVTHSMGGLILASAIRNGFCSLGHDSKWVALQAPMQGSRTNDFLLSHCDKANATQGNFWGSHIPKLLYWSGWCPVPRAYRGLSIENGDFIPAEINRFYVEVQQVYRDNVYAAMCGNSVSGLVTMKSAEMNVSAPLSNHRTHSDGVVDEQSCVAGLDREFSENLYDNRWYKASVNHFDGTFRHGDGWWGSHRKPVRWFECLL